MKILVFSDGTGNSNAKLFRTNVWRLYDALDLTEGQVATYDNGVGTASFLPLALLGGAFGWGLKRNVLDLYAFLCRNYHQHPGPHRIYAFGFSRGAFTIRVLLGLIRSQGLVPYTHDERELRRLARWAFRSYRGELNSTGGLVGPLRALRDAVLTRVEGWRGKAGYATVPRVTGVPVEFVGLWDTVAAYGLPAIELTRGWDRWVWPLSLPTRTPYRLIGKACHALALDDERQTFHPLLWDETDEDSVFRAASGDRGESHSRAVRDERISQVWFAGMHSNVGGGYPDDGMAHDSLVWIVEQALALDHPIVLKPGALDEWRRRRTTSSPMSNSRQGAGAYYRYLPRLVAAITQDPESGVCVPRPKIHHSVFDRRRDNTAGYAPLVLPERYAVVGPDGIVRDPGSARAETPDQAAQRASRQATAWDIVWLRRVSYFATVAATLMLLLLAVIPVAPGRAPVLSGSLPTLSALIGLAGSMLPGLVSPLVDHFKDYPLQLVVFGAVIYLLMQYSNVQDARLSDAMRKAWSSEAPPDAASLRLVRRIRTSPAYVATIDWFRYRALPNVAGLAMLTLLVLGGVIALLRMAFDVPMLVGGVCRPDSGAREVGTAWVAGASPFLTNQVCQPMGVRLARGRTYEIEISPSGWLDRTHPVPGLAGFASDAPVFYLAAPLRRHLRLNWFVPVARVGAIGDENFPVQDTPTRITPLKSGSLYLYVNDVLPLGQDAFFYRNNQGSAQVRIRQVD